MTRDILVKWLIDFRPVLVQKMKESEHGYENKPMPFHIEGSVWTHTMMVMTYIENYFEFNENKNTTLENKIILLTSALLHDIGKPESRIEKESEERGKYYAFLGHEGLSTFKSIMYLNQLKSDFPEYYNEDIIKEIIFIVSTHGVAIQENDENKLFLRETFRTADKKGAVRAVDENTKGHYSNRSFAKNKNKETGKELIMLVGLPCSGKSTLIKERYSDYTILSRDNMIEIFYKNFSQSGVKYSYNHAYKWIHEDEKNKKAFNQWFESQLRDFSKTEKKVVIDMTMLSMSTRRKMLNTFNKFNAKAVVLFSELRTIQLRNILRSGITNVNDLNSFSDKACIRDVVKSENEELMNDYLKTHTTGENKYISNKVYKDMKLKFIVPVIEEGFDDIEYIIN